MALEIEVKIRMPDDSGHQQLRQKLPTAGGQHAGVVHETNVFFDRPDRSLLNVNAGLRVRKTVAEGTGEVRGLLTYKGPPQPHGLRSREAFDVHVDPPDETTKLLVALGYQETLRFEKRRETWLLDGCNVELDEIAELGKFVEIEGPTEDAVLAVRKKLGLDTIEPEHLGYAVMIAKRRGRS